MARAPFQVLVLPFRSDESGDVTYGILRRTDDSAWQGIAGGGEYGESIVDAARREAWEEAGIPATVPLYRLEMQDFVPVNCFKARAEWPPDLDDRVVGLLQGHLGLLLERLDRERRRARSA